MAHCCSICHVGLVLVLLPSMPLKKLVAVPTTELSALFPTELGMPRLLSGSAKLPLLIKYKAAPKSFLLMTCVWPVKPLTIIN